MCPYGDLARARAYVPIWRFGAGTDVCAYTKSWDMRGCKYVLKKKIDRSRWISLFIIIRKSHDCSTKHGAMSGKHFVNHWSMPCGTTCASPTIDRGHLLDDVACGASGSLWYDRARRSRLCCHVYSDSRHQWSA